MNKKIDDTMSDSDMVTIAIPRGLLGYWLHVSQQRIGYWESVLKIPERTDIPRSIYRRSDHVIASEGIRDWSLARDTLREAMGIKV